MNDQSTKPCPFCTLSEERIVIADSNAMAILDGFPISPGHTLIIPKRHVATFFETTVEERTSILQLLDEAKRKLDAQHQPAAYNMGINDGPAAGQTVPHLHVHLIPRYEGDAPDPRGGIRRIFPDKAEYWKK